MGQKAKRVEWWTGAFSMKLNVLFAQMYQDIAQGKHQVVIPPHSAANVETRPDGIKRVRFTADRLDLVADFQGDTLQVNLATGKPLATLVHGEVRAYESDYRHMLY